jgi:hypothetical protein
MRLRQRPARAPSHRAEDPATAARPGRGGWRHLTTALALVAGLLGSGAMVWQGTNAVFSSTTASSGNTWTLGSVTLADDDAGSALFAVPQMVPGDQGENCLTVDYTGDVAATVKLYATAPTDPSSVAQYVHLVIEEGSGGGFGDCTGFVAGGAPIYTGTLASFTAGRTDHGSGVGGWSPSSAASTVYRIGWTLDAATPSGKQGSVTTVTFRWESQA